MRLINLILSQFGIFFTAIILGLALKGLGFDKNNFVGISCLFAFIGTIIFWTAMDAAGEI